MGPRVASSAPARQAFHDMRWTFVAVDVCSCSRQCSNACPDGAAKKEVWLHHTRWTFVVKYSRNHQRSDACLDDVMMPWPATLPEGVAGSTA